MSESKTTFENKCAILAEVSLRYKHDKDWEDFVHYNDIGLPLAYLLTYEIVEPTDRAILFIEETWEVFMNTLSPNEIEWLDDNNEPLPPDWENQSFESLDDVLLYFSL